MRLDEELDRAIGDGPPHPEMQRRVVVLRHWLGLSVEETAADLRISTGTVKSHSSRAIAKLQEQLADLRVRADDRG